MSRFLEYGVFVPAGDTAQKQAATDRLGSTTSRGGGVGATGRWAKVAGKWVKTGADEQSLDVADAGGSATFSKTLPATGSSSSSAAADRALDAFARTTDSSFGTSGDKPSRAAGGLTSSAGGLPSSSEDAYGRTGSWETPPTTTSDSYDEAQSELDASPRSMLRGNGSSSSNNVAAALDGEEADEDQAGGEREVEASRGERGMGGGSSSEGLTVDASTLQETGSLGVKDENDDDMKGGLHLSGDPTANNNTESESRSSSTLMLTPGISRTYSKEEVVQKFFGADADGEQQQEAAAAESSALGTAAGNAFGSESGGAACVGERSTATKSNSSEGGAVGRAKSRKSAAGGTSPGGHSTGKIEVETRDVACQWDGSEMGDGSDDEDAFPQVDLPDTPDCMALTAVLRLYDHARLENKRTGVRTSRRGWGVDENIENWDGVYLDTDDRVVALDVDGDPDNRQAVLIGPLPVELAEMDHLEQLTMRRHRFKGRIPAEFGRLSRLTHLNLSNCRLIGYIPTEFGELANLVVLNLSWNFLSGDLPPELGKLSHLEELLVNSNAFSGAIPPEFGKLKKLQRFNAGHNIGLSGALPPEMSRLTQLTLLDLRHNKISGKIPPLFGRLTSLQQLWLQDNQLTDEIPAELARLPKLQMLHLSNNKLSGTIPMALRGHPRYRNFKILPGNFALGERVAPNEKEVEAAARRMPSMNAMAHASGALAQSQQQAQVKAAAQRRVTQSLSPTRQSGGRRSIERPPVADLTPEEAKRRSGGRNSMGRRLRGMKRIMGKKPTPPATPTRARSGTEDSEKSLSPGATVNSTGGLVRGTAVGGSSVGSAFSPRSELAFEGSEADARIAQGKAFLEAGSTDGVEVGARVGEEDQADGSPNPTASLSNGTGASGHASPSSHESKELGTNDGGVSSVGSAGAPSAPGAASTTMHAA